MPTTPLTLRPPQYPADLEAVAAAITAADPRFPVPPALLAEWRAAHDPALKVTELLAVRGAEVVGVAWAAQQDAAELQHVYWLNLWVAAAHQRRGVGRTLLRALEENVTALGGRDLKVGVRQDVPAAVALAEASGYARTWTRYELVLEVTPESDLSRFEPLLARLDADGLRLHNVAELSSDPARDRQLWELDWALISDVPLGMPISKTPLEVWVQQDLEESTFAPELSFVALDPAVQHPATGPYLGFSTLSRQPGGFYTIGMTGVLPAHRGRGVAKALKVMAMRALLARGGGTIRTFNDPPNVAMITMNEALGFVRAPDVYRYGRTLEQA